MVVCGHLVAYHRRAVCCGDVNNSVVVYMSDIKHIERIAKGILRKFYDSRGHDYLTIAEAESYAKIAIFAMREPTPRMLRMLQLHIDHGSHAINAWQDTIAIACDDAELMAK